MASLAASLSSPYLHSMLGPFHPNCLRLTPHLLHLSNRPSSKLHSYSRKFSGVVCRVGDPVFATKPPLTASDLQEKFGCEGLQFTDIGGMTVIELKLSNGSSARVLLQAARITSYKPLLWHGGFEEMLHTDVLSEATEGKFSITGGIFLSFSNTETKLPLLEENWCVDDVKVDSGDLVQVNLRCIGGGTMNKNENSWPCLQYVITLSNQGLVSAVVISNKGQLPITFAGLVETQVAVSALAAVSVTGLRGSDFCSPANKLSKEAALSDSANQGGWSLMGKLTKLFWSNQNVKSDVTDNVRNKELIADNPNGTSVEQCSMYQAVDESSWLTEKDDAALVRRGMHKVYASPPEQIRVVDMGFRRSLIFERLGFVDFILHSPELDLELNDEASFVCVGSASVLDPVLLSPGRIWNAAQIVIPDV